MDFETFKEEVRGDIEKALYERTGTEHSVGIHTVEKMNETYEALTIKPENSDIGVNINANELFRAYSDGMDYNRLVDGAVNKARDALEISPNFNIEAFKDYDKMKETLAMEVVSAERNAELLTTVPHKDMEDMAVVYRFVISTGVGESGSVLVTNKMLDQYGITPEQLHADAMKNAPEVRPMEIKGMGEVLAEQMGIENAEMLGFAIPPEQDQMLVASVKGNVHGAGVLAYEDFMEKASDRVGGEILGLRWEDIDFENTTISINHSLVYYKDEETGKCAMKIHLPKTESGIRIIPMLEIVEEALEMAKDEQEFEGAEQPVVDGMTGFVFLNKFGDVLNQQSVNRAIKRILEYYNYEEDLAATKEGREPVLLPHFSAHVLRHTFATRLCRVCTNLKVIQYIMGHKSIETTMDVYAEATGDKNKEVFEILSEALADLF